MRDPIRTENEPSRSVVAPMVVPSTITVAPVTGFPALSFTTPFTTALAEARAAESRFAGADMMAIILPSTLLTTFCPANIFSTTAQISSFSTSRVIFLFTSASFVLMTNE